MTSRDEMEAYELVELRDGGICLFHGFDCDGPVQRDHRKNRSQGGGTTLLNLQLLCLRHHDWKTNHPKEAAKEGWAVPGWADPATYPGRRYHRDARGFTSIAWCVYRPTLEPGFVIITRREAARRIADGRLYPGEAL